MANWADIELAEPHLARRLRGRFESHPHHVLGTLDASGAPRLSGINVFFNEGILWFGSMPHARKAIDLSRDPRLSLHTATLSETLDGGDGRVSGVAVPISSATVARWRPESPTEGVFFSVDVLSVHLVEVVDNQLVVTMWDTRHGLRIVKRQ
jgi:hypothetical protein